MPLFVSTPEISTEIDAGAAPCASAASGWKGTTNALVEKPTSSSARAILTDVFILPGISEDSCAKFSVCALAYRMIMPVRIQVEPMHPTTRYLNAASSAP